MTTGKHILDDLRAAIAQTKPIQYYATYDALPAGTVLLFNGDWYWPQTLFCHPADFEAQRAELSHYCRLVHIRDWRPTQGQQARAWQEIIDSLRKEARP